MSPMKTSSTSVGRTTSSRVAAASVQPSQLRKTFFSRLGRPLTLRRIYYSAVRRFLHGTFFFWQRLGIHAVPVHFYHPIPDTRLLPSDIWSRRYPLTGLDLRLERQIDLLRTFAAYRAEYNGFPIEPVPHGFYINNDRFEAVDAEVLYCMIRKFKPRRIYEIGSGFSTLMALLAVSANEAEGALPCEIMAIEPDPPFDLIAQERVQIRQMPVERLSLEEFDRLEANDILFIDSSHTIRIGGDVVREYLEMLPRLNPGVLVHCHDIFLPGEYPREYVIARRTFWDEQYLLHAFLLFNSHYEVMWSSHYLHLNHRQALKDAFPSYSTCPTPPSSFWIRRTAA